MTWNLGFEIAAAALGVAGSLLLATRSRWAGWAFVLWLLSNAGWIAFGTLRGHWFLVTQNVVFLVTSCIGVWVWLLRPWLRYRGMGPRQRAIAEVFDPVRRRP